MSILELDADLDSPLSGGAAGTTSLAPFVREVAINGRAYRIDHNAPEGAQFSRRSVPIQRAQADTSTSPGEQTLNREGDWRRVVESWHRGAGQTYFDRTDSDPFRFNTSKGVNPWDKWSLSLLNDTASIRTSANTNLRLTTAGGYTYLIDGNDLLFTSDVTAGPVVWTLVTGTPATAAQWITTDGYNVYVAYGASGIYSTTRGAATATSYNTLVCTVLAYVKGRLMAANSNVIYNVTASGAPPAALMTKSDNSDFAWVAFADAPGFIYAAGYSGNRSLIYKTAIQPDGTALSAPSEAGGLPIGEVVRSVKGYLGLLVIGSDAGVRLATINESTGNLTIGSLIPTTSPVLNFEPAERFIWFGMSNYDATSTGLGRIDLTALTSTLTPAYASDLMATAQGSVQSISTQGTKRVFTVSGVGVFVETSLKVASGTLTSGRITYGLGDEKVAMYLDLRTAALAGSVAMTLAVDSGTPASIGGSTVAGSTRPTYPLNANQARGEFFETTLTLTRDATATTTGPSINRYTLRAYPAPSRTFQFTVPILLYAVQSDENGTDYGVDPLVERQAIESLMKDSQVTSYQEGGASYTVLVDDVVWLPRKQTSDANTYDGTLVAVLKELVA